MNGEQLVAEAAKLIAKGESYYHQAAEKIEQAAARGIPNTEIAVALGRSKDWVRLLRNWHAQGGDPDSAPFGGEERQVLREASATRKTLRDAPPEQIAEMLEDPAIRRKVYDAQDIQRGRIETESKAAFREAVGDNTVDSLDEQQRIHDAEARAFDARRALRDMLALLNDADLDAMRDSWREDFLKTLDDLSMRIDAARSLLAGTLDEDIERFLSEV